MESHLLFSLHLKQLLFYMLKLFIRLKHFILHFNLPVSELLQNLNIFIRVLIQRNSLVLIFIEVVHDLRSKLLGLIRFHSILSYQVILNLLEIYESITSPLAIVANVDLVELDSQFHLHAVIKLLLPFKFCL